MSTGSKSVAKKKVKEKAAIAFPVGRKIVF